MRRRSLLRFALGLAALPVWARGLLGAPIGPGGRTAYPLTAFAPFLDTLIPTGGPDIAEVLRDKMRLQSGYVNLVRRGCRWLDDAARGRGAEDFAALDADGRAAVIVLVAAEPRRSPQRIFFERTRADAMAAYYGEPAAWAGIGYDGPPQPRGFRDHDRAPR